MFLFKYRRWKMVASSKEVPSHHIDVAQVHVEFTYLDPSNLLLRTDFKERSHAEVARKIVLVEVKREESRAVVHQEGHSGSVLVHKLDSHPRQTELLGENYSLHVVVVFVMRHKHWRRVVVGVDELECAQLVARLVDFVVETHKAAVSELSEHRVFENLGGDGGVRRERGIRSRPDRNFALKAPV